MKICIVGPAHPYRGGLASIMEIMARTFASRGHDVGIKTFTVQYPSFLFPGKSQTVSALPPADLHIKRCVNTVDPFNWWRVGRAIRRERPDFVLMKYWTPFMAPCFGTIARLARGNGHTRTICQIDNVEPHEHHLVDRPFNRYFLSSIDGFIYMSEQVHEELKAYTSAPALFSPHPLFENFGAAVARDEACRRLGLDPAQRYALFFGLIRDYKGLDILLDAWARFRRPGHRLIVAGEFYASRERYVRQIEELHLGEEVILHDFFVPDADVKYYFSAADVRRDADRLQFRTADDCHRRGRSARDRTRRPCGVCLPPRCRGRRRCPRPDLRRRYARAVPLGHARGETAFFVGGDVRPDHRVVRVDPLTPFRRKAKAAS